MRLNEAVVQTSGSHVRLTRIVLPDHQRRIRATFPGPFVGGTTDRHYSYEEKCALAVELCKVGKKASYQPTAGDVVEYAPLLEALFW